MQQDSCIPGEPGCFSVAPTAPVTAFGTPPPQGISSQIPPELLPSPEGTVYGGEPYEVWRYRVDSASGDIWLVISMVGPILSELAPGLADLGAAAGALSFVAFVVSIPLSGGVTFAIAGGVGAVSGVVSVGSTAASALGYALEGNYSDASAQVVGLAIGKAFGFTVNSLTSSLMTAYGQIPLVGRVFRGVPSPYEAFPELQELFEGFASNLYNGVLYLQENPIEECPPWLLPRALCEPFPE